MPLRLRRLLPGYKLVHRWWLVEDVQPNLVTHQRVELPAVRKRLAEIEAFLLCTCGQERLDKLHGRSNWWRIFSTPRTGLREECDVKQQFDELKFEMQT